MINLFLANVDPCHCDTTFEPARCYKDRTDQRLLQNYILNERDPTLSNYRGKSIEWTNWQNYLPEFICRCANEAKLLGFDVFGIQFYGKEFFASMHTFASTAFVLHSIRKLYTRICKFHTLRDYDYDIRKSP